MKIAVTKTDLNSIQPYRILFLHEGNFQFVCNSFHQRNWADSYMFFVDDVAVGYGSLWGDNDRTVRDTIFEFYVIPTFRKSATRLFKELLVTSAAKRIACQSNDLLLTGMLYEFANNINSEAILFKDNAATNLICDKGVFRAKKDNDILFEHKAEPEGDYVIEVEGKIVATGGFLLHYNMPYADLYMEVVESHRKKGFGSFLIQELKKACYLAGRVPAARTGTDNKASKATLLKAGFAVCGHRLSGEVKKPAEK